MSEDIFIQLSLLHLMTCELHTSFYWYQYNVITFSFRPYLMYAHGEVYLIQHYVVKFVSDSLF